MPEDLVYKNVDVIVDAIEDDGQLKHKEYIVDSSQELFKKHIVLTQNSFETVYYTIYNNEDENNDKPESDEEDIHEYALLHNYDERNLLILN